MRTPSTHRPPRPRLRPHACSVGLIAAALAPHAAAQDVIESCARAAESSQVLRDADRLVEARHQLRTCARDACPTVVRNDCRSWLAEVDALVPSLIILANDEHGRPLPRVLARIDDRSEATLLDGKPIEIDPGAHRITLQADHHATSTREVVVRTGEKNRKLTVTLARSDKPATPPPEPATTTSSSVPTLSWVLFGVGAAALGAGAYLGLDARSDVADMRDSCAPACPSSDVDDARRQLLIADVALATGVVAAGAATWIIFAHDDGHAALSVAPQDRGVSARCRWSF